MAQITGVSSWCRTVVGRLRVPKCCAPPPGDSVPAPPMPLPSAASFRSRPLQKPRPAPVMMITRTSSSVSASLSRRVSSSSISKLIAFRRSGRLSVIDADVVGLLVEQVSHVSQSSFGPPRTSFSICAKARNAPPPSPTNVEPCIAATVRGCRSAKRVQRVSRERCVRHVVRQRPSFIVEQRPPRPRNDVRRGDGLDVTAVREQVGAQQDVACLFEEHPRLPAVRHLRRLLEAPAERASRQHLVVQQRPRRAVREVIDAHRFTDEAAQRLGVRRSRQPLVERTALVGLEVAEADPAQARRIDQRSDRLTHHRKETPHPRVKQQRLVVASQELAELQIRFGNERRNTKQLRSDFRHSSHRVSPSYALWPIARRKSR